MGNCRLAFVIGTVAATMVACSPTGATPPGVANPTGPVVNTVSFGGRVDELCYVITTNPSLPGAAYVVRVTPSDGLLESADTSGLLDDHGQAQLGWKLRSGISGEWTIAAEITPAGGTTLRTSVQAGADQTGNEHADNTPACPRS